MSTHTTTRALCVVKRDGLYDAAIQVKSIPPLQPNQVLVRMNTAAFNHREVCVLSFKQMATINSNGSAVDSQGAIS